MNTIEIEINTDITGITLVTLSRPEKLNAMTQPLIDELVACLNVIADNTTCRVVIITGAGKAFSAGGDLTVFQRSQRNNPEIFKNLLTSAGTLAIRVRSMPQPVIAAVNGPAVGGGFALALAADVRICAESAFFSNALVKLGLSGFEMGMSALLPQIIGPNAAFEITASGRRIGSAEARELRLVLETSTEKNLLKRAYEIADSFAVNSPIGIEMTKKSSQMLFPVEQLSLVIQQEIRNQLICLATEDHVEALHALTEDRKAKFTGT